MGLLALRVGVPTGQMMTQSGAKESQTNRRKRMMGVGRFKACLKAMRTMVWWAQRLSRPYCGTASPRQAIEKHLPPDPIIISANPSELGSNDCPDVVKVIWGMESQQCGAYRAGVG